jgi:hypothetical protein
MLLAPIVLFVYNRPEHTRKTIEALQKNELASDSELFIYSDGVKNEVDIIKVKEIRDYIKKVDGFKSVTIVERKKNFGLVNSIVGGVTEIVNKFGKIIVLEDDIITSSYFLSYMNESLKLYEREEKVMHISGYLLPVDTTNLPETFFYNQTSCWGWGTWDRAWASFNSDIDYLLEKVSVLDGTFRDKWYNKNTLSQLKANKSGRINTWGAKWQASVSLNSGFCLHPKMSYVNNIGHDGSGIHSSVNSLYEISNFGVNFNLKKIDIVESKDVLKLMNDFFSTHRPSFFSRVSFFLKSKII